MDRWVKRADHIISGCDWVEYMYHWDTLMLAHFVIDTELWTPNKQNKKITSLDNPFKILHCPNHVNIKGTKHF